MGLMQRVADEAMAALSGAEGVLVGLSHDDDSLTFVCGSGYLQKQIGGTVPLDGSLSGLALRTGETLRCDDVNADPRVHLELSRAYGVGSSICVPLRRAGETVGVLNVASTRAHAFNDRDVAILTKLAQFISVVIAAATELSEVTKALLSSSELDAGISSAFEVDLAVEERFVANVLSPGTVRDLETRRRIERVLEGHGVTLVFQPVFDLSTGQVFSVEALSRFAGPPRRTPDLWFAEAHAVDLGIELELLAVQAALAALSGLPRDVALCVNAGPDAIASGDVLQLVTKTDSRRVVIELTEQVKVDDYPHLLGAIKRLRLMGARLAIDDTGAGFASLAHILKLDPDLIKLDRDLTSGIDRDPVRRALASALVTFAAHTDAQIIAEGIENAAELDVLRDLGIRYGQGYFLARPTSVESISWQPIDQILSRPDAEAS